MVPRVCRLQDVSEAQRAESSRRFKEAKEAYEILSDGEATPRSCVSAHAAGLHGHARAWSLAPN